MTRIRLVSTLGLLGLVAFSLALLWDNKLAAVGFTVGAQGPGQE